MLNRLSLLLIAAAAPVHADWRVGRTAGGPASAPAVTLSAAGALGLGDGTILPAGAWYGVRRTGTATPDPAAAVLFTNGDRLAGAPVDSDGTTMRLRPAFADPAGVTVTVPVSSVAAVVSRWPTDDELAAEAATPKPRDIVISPRGDRTAGTVTALDDAGLNMRDGDKDVVLKRPAVAAVWFNTDLARIRKPKGRYYRLTLTDGTRWAVAGISWDAVTATVTTFGKETVQLPTKMLLAVDVEQGAAVSLGDVKPAKEQYQSFDSETRSWQPDNNALGRPMRIMEAGAESTVSRGLGLAGGMTVTYDLAGKYKRLDALVALDARYGRRGDLIVRVTKDGEAVALPADGRASLTPVEWNIDLAGCKTLTITVERGRRAGVEEMLNMANAKLIP